MDALGGAGVRLAALLLGATLAVAGCDASIASLPTHRMTDGGPAAILPGTLIDRAGCIFLRSATAEHLVLWPPGFGRVGTQIVRSGNPVAQIGELVELTGGEYRDDAFEFLQSELLQNDVPAACRSPLYWLATAVVPQPAD